MNTDQIDYALHARCRGQFIGVFPADRLPARLPTRRPLLMVCNTDPHYRRGTHWIAIYLGSNSRGEYYDSFGQAPPPVFERYMNKLCTSWIINDRQPQSAACPFCGQYCISYRLFRSLN